MPQGLPTGHRPATWEDLIRVEAAQAKVSPELAIAVARSESSLDPAAKSPKGAIGLFQLMPATAAGLGIADPSDPIQNIRGGVKYLRQLADQYGGDVSKTLAAYNMGPTAYDREGKPFPETEQYVSRVLGQLAPQPKPVTAPVTPMRPVPSHTPGVGEPPPSGFLMELAKGLDPRTPTGRRNLAGAGGAVAGVALAPVTGGGSLAATAALISAGVLGGAGGGMLAEAWEQLVGTKPPSPGAVLGAGAEQGAYELGGQALMWPLRFVGRRLIATPIARHAKEALKAGREEISLKLRTLVEGASDAYRAVRETAADAIRGAREAAGAGVEAARTAGRAQVRGAREAAEIGVARFREPGVLPTPAVTRAEVGRQAQRVIRGPAQHALDELGEAVEEAAKTGPDVDITALKAEAQRIFGEELRPPREAFPVKPPPAETRGAAIKPAETFVTPPGASRQMQQLMEKQRRVAAEATKAAEAAAEEQAQTTLKHPAMSVVGRILNAEDTVPFAAAHQFKRELDEAIGVAWEKSVRNRVTNVTKHLRSTLRGTLKGHDPYDTATAAYEAIVPLFRSGMAPKLRRLATAEPEAIVRLISANKPTEARMLRDLLVGQAEKGGAPAEGQAAWDAVRGAWTHSRVIAGGIEKLGENLGKIPTDFAEVFYGDASGKAVLDHLGAIAGAYEQALTGGRAGVVAARETAGTAIREAQRVGREAVRGVARQVRPDIRAARQALTDFQRAKTHFTQDLTPAEKAFAKSSLGQAVRPAYGVGTEADIARVVLLNPTNPWWITSTIRLLNAPVGKELVEWSAFSPKGWQYVVDALTGPEPGMGVANLIRLTGIGSLVADAVRGYMLEDLARDEAVGTPPPAGTTPARPQPALSHQVGSAPPG